MVQNVLVSRPPGSMLGQSLLRGLGYHVSVFLWEFEHHGLSAPWVGHGIDFKIGKFQ